MNGSIFLFRLLALRPYVDEYSWKHVEHLKALELSDWDALKAVYKVLGLTREMMERLEGEHIPIGLCALKYLLQFVCIMGPTVPFILGRSVERSAMHRCPIGMSDGG